MQFYRMAERLSQEGLSRVNPPRLSRQLRPIGVLGRTPVDAFQQIAQLRGRDRHSLTNRCGPDEAAPIQALGEQAKALAVVPQQLHQAPALAAEHKHMPAMRI